jgi:Rieske 2Fe-2S family protein
MQPAIDPEFGAAVAATARPFATAETPPGRLFWDPALYQRDLDEIFGRMWLCVGHQSRITEPGEFFSVEFGTESILVVRGDDRQTRAFLNVCRHRGTRVSLEAGGRCRGFLCPYHAWHYGLDGRLRAAPGMDEVAGFRREDFPLIEVRLDTFLGFLFINLSADAEPLADAYADFPDLDRYRLHDLQRVARHDYDVASNWKLICENYHECYHCGIAHPQLHRISDYGALQNDDSSGRLFVGGPMAIKQGFRSMTMDGGSRREPFDGLTDADRRKVLYFNLLPNFLLSIAPDYVLTHHIWPRGAEQVYIETEWFCSPEQIAADGFDIADAEEFWDTTNKQDWALCENALKGLKSRRHRPGRYHTGEDCAHRFDQWYVRQMFPQVTEAVAGQAD